MKHLPKKLAQSGLIVGVTSAAVPAMAAIDTTAAEAEITSAVTAIGAVGGGILIAAATSFAYRWVKATFF